mgnify:CR=1 FL=1
MSHNASDYKSGNSKLRQKWISASVLALTLAIVGVKESNGMDIHAKASDEVPSSVNSEQQNVASDNSVKADNNPKNLNDSNKEKSSNVNNQQNVTSSNNEQSNEGSNQPQSNNYVEYPKVGMDASQDFKSHIREIDGKDYYYKNNVAVRAQVIRDGNKDYYFGNDGALTTHKPSMDSGNITTSDNVSIYNQDSSSITNTNGFITADSWYRPKKIQVNQNDWRSSNSNDLRPLLSVWWPSKTVEINYLNYMSSKGLISGTFDNNSTDSDLNSAAQQIRLNIEKKIQADNGKTDSIKTLFNNFVKSQDQWNIKSENLDYNDGFQGGTLLFNNNSQNTKTNSNYRLLNRAPTQQNGKVNYKKTGYAGYEFLLGDDVDNSNPVVQAETLNWIYYLTNFGSIYKKNNKANFDGMRVDAVDNMDADILNILGKYYRDAYGINKSDKKANQHLNILEDWSINDPYYLKDHGSDQITIDAGFKDAMENALTASPDKRTNLSTLINAGLVNRSNDTKYNKNLPNYSIIRAHDSGVQAIVGKIVTDKVDPSAGNPNLEQINKAFKYYNADENSANKQYTFYNIPAAYALLLTNKDTTPRVYYGDMYTDNGQFMAKKTPYFSSIESMLKGRIKYVSGGQAMSTVKVNNGNDDVLVSVRFGKGANSGKSKGTNLTRTSGIAVVESNNPNLKLGKKDKVVIYMGAAHKNQAYRPLLDTTNKGITVYNSDKKARKQVVHTNSKGYLTLTRSKIKGYSNPQVSGYLSMWVPVGASSKQDVRTDPSSKVNKDGKSYHSNAALDSNVIFEAFSNFQSFAKNKKQYTNVVLSTKGDFFKNLGITNVELAPQYRSTDDGTFLDSTVQNGYAFNDRYDLGFNKPTKYGTADQLVKAISSLHSKGIKVLADFVPDQLYSLPNQQIVNATRVNSVGKISSNSDLINLMYEVFSEGNGQDYQAKYGGKFLNILKKKFPSIFKMKQISTGKRIDPSVKIKSWEAKYLNGMNIQGKGAEYVLSNAFGGEYFTVVNSNNKDVYAAFLPKEILGENVQYGLSDDQQSYTSTGGYTATNSFVKDRNGNWYYADAQGKFVTGYQVINGHDYYFLPDGVNLRDGFVMDENGVQSYYQSNGIKATEEGYYFSNNNGQIIHLDKNGKSAKGYTVVDGNKQFFDNNGYQLKDVVKVIKGHRKYFEQGSGNEAISKYFEYNGNWYYADKNGNFVRGYKVIDGIHVFFYNNGVQAKDKFVVNKNKTLSYYGGQFSSLQTGKFVVNGVNYVANKKGEIIAKNKTIKTDGATYFLDSKSKVKNV